ncbi:MAG: xanthine dehydrogenase family protein subunit M [Syntrophaceae bacterium]|nr:xanthine dehydrogenase family protein subunit M [Syntrophaceae bacterium]
MRDPVSKSHLWKKPCWEKYFRVKTPGEAVQILEELQGESRVIAGGTDLLARMRQEGFGVKALVDITCIPGLGEIRSEDGLIRLGAVATPKDLSQSSVLREKAFCLAQAASQIGTPQIRNLGTLGGNLCNASPAADLAPPLLIFEAKAKIAGGKGEREVPLDSFFTGPGQTVLNPSEILKEIIIPELRLDASATFLKLGRRKAADLALVSVAVLLAMDRKERTCQLIRIGLGSVAPTPIRAKQAEAFLIGRRLDDRSIQEAAQSAMRESQPISDVRASSQYRREMVGVMVERAIRKCLEQLEGKDV